MSSENISFYMIILSAIGTTLAAVAAWRAASVTQKVAEAGLGYRLQDKYDKREMRDDLRLLEEFHREQGDSFTRKWTDGLEANEDWADKIDLARRRVKGYFLNTAQLYKKHLISKDLLLLITDQAGLNMLYTVVEPLERALSPEYEKEYFEVLRQICPEPRSVRYIRRIPSHEAT